MGTEIKSINGGATKDRVAKVFYTAPAEVAGFSNVIVPVVDVGRKYSNFFKAQSNSVTGTGNIYSTPSTKDFFITTIGIEATWDVASDNAYCYISFYTDGKINYVKLEHTTATATDKNIVLTFPYPLKVDRGSIIGYSNTFTAGALKVDYYVAGILEEAFNKISNWD